MNSTMKRLLLLILRKYIINKLYINHRGKFIDDVLKSLGLNELSINEAKGFDKISKTDRKNWYRVPFMFMTEKL